MYLLLIIPIIIVLIINFIVAKKFEKIAFQKGYDDSISSFAMCFWLGIIGYLYVIALPNLINSNVTTDNKVTTYINKTSNSDNTNLKTIDPNKEKYDKLVAKAEKYKDSFFDRNYRITIFESIVKDMEVFANENFEDSIEKLKEYTNYLELLKTKKIK